MLAARRDRRRQRLERSSTRATPTGYVLLPSLCVGATARSTRSSSSPAAPLRAGAHGRGDARERDLGRADAGAAGRRRRWIRSRTPSRRPPADRRRGAALARSRIRRRTTTSARSGASAPACRWCSPSGPPRARLRRRALARARPRALRGAGRGPLGARAPGAPGGRASTAGPPGFLARYFEKLRYRFGARERAGRSAASSRWPPSAARARRRARAALRETARVALTRMAVDVAPGPRRGDPRAGARGRAARRRRRRDAPALARPGRGRARRRRAAQPARPTRTRSRSSSTGTSTTRTSASRTATSAPSTAARATAARATSCRKPVIFKKIEETLALGGTAC